MNHSDKEKLYKQFLNRWNKQFNQVKYILDYIFTYPEIIDKLDDFQRLSTDELQNSQLEWVSLVAQFDNPIETMFFKDYWVPIQKNGYDYFIDLSSESLPLFEVHYFFFEPYRWYKKYIYKDLSQFLINIDNPRFNVEHHFKQLDEERWTEVSHYFNERDELGFAGKLEIDPINKESIFIEGENSNLSLQDNCITISGINSVIVGLLPHDCSIMLNDFKAPHNRNENVCNKVKNINALVYLLQSVGMLSIDSYSIEFNSDKECKADFKNNTFKIIHNDKDFLNGLIEKYETYRDS